MASINRIKPGQILWDYHRYRVGNTRMTKEGEWPVKVIEVDMVKRRALISWNGNDPQWRNETAIKRYRVKRKVKK